MNSVASFLETVGENIKPSLRELLGAYLDKETKNIAYYQIAVGGKRLRPALAIASCLLLGGKMKDVLYPAAGLEILHNNTLIIDDIIDHSLLRRNRPTAWAHFGKSIAECLSLAYSVSFSQAAIKSKEPLKISETFIKAMKMIVEGEILDILFEQSGRQEEPYIIKNRYLKITEKDYFKMIRKKTAFLFQSCCEVGAICSQAKEKEIKALKNYGLKLGIAFQIKDDILDIFGGEDIKERKLGNIVILFSLKELPSKDKNKILRIMRKKKIKDSDIKEALQLIKKTNSYEKAYQLGEKYIKRAKENLKILPQNKWNNILSEMADFVIERKK